MARSRNIKPGFFNNEHIAALSPHARLLFIGLWTLADREGRLEDRPKRIKVDLFPYEDLDIDALLEELKESAGNFILRYQVNNNDFIQVVNFRRHQFPHIKECASIIPAPDQHQTSIIPAPDKHHATKNITPPASGAVSNTGQAPDKHRTSTGQESLIPDSLNLIPDSLNPQPHAAPPNNIFQYFGTHFQSLTDKMAGKLNEAINFYSEEWVLDALKEAKERGKCNWGYAEAILKNRDSAGKNSKPSIERNKSTEIRGQFSAATNARVAAQFKAAREEDDKKAKGAK
jgi:DnaD/phage-associated family protein